jgi:hypothetical protein
VPEVTLPSTTANRTGKPSAQFPDGQMFFQSDNPFFPADQVIGRVTRNGIGGSGGFGFEAGMRGGTKFFLEARYHYASTGAIPTRMIPVTIGIRF